MYVHTTHMGMYACLCVAFIPLLNLAVIFANEGRSEALSNQVV